MVLRSHRLNRVGFFWIKNSGRSQTSRHTARTSSYKFPSLPRPLLHTTPANRPFTSRKGSSQPPFFPTPSTHDSALSPPTRPQPNPSPSPALTAVAAGAGAACQGAQVGPCRAGPCRTPVGVARVEGSRGARGACPCRGACRGGGGIRRAGSQGQGARGGSPALGPPLCRVGLVVGYLVVRFVGCDLFDEKLGAGGGRLSVHRLGWGYDYGPSELTRSAGGEPAREDETVGRRVLSGRPELIAHATFRPPQNWGGQAGHRRCRQAIITHTNSTHHKHRKGRVVQA